jgi:hypothetical protein
MSGPLAAAGSLVFIELGLELLFGWDRLGFVLPVDVEGIGEAHGIAVGADFPGVFLDAEKEVLDASGGECALVF